MTQAQKPKTILEAISQWSLGRPLWQQDALRRIVRNGVLGDSDFKDLTTIAKMARNTNGVEIDANPLSTAQIPAAPDKGGSIRLSSITEVEGVNQLAAGQTLGFEPTGITVICGQNGTGKSGYSRILKRVCRARMPGEKLPDIAQAEPVEPRASIAFQRGDANDTLAWSDSGAPDAALSAVTVFDRDSGAVHIQKKNAAWFTPFGLDVPNTLATVCDEISTRLKAEKAEAERARNAVFNAPIWAEGSVLGACLNDLAADTDVVEVFDSVLFAEDDAKRLERLAIDLAPENDPLKSAEDHRRAANKIDRLRSFIETNGEILCDDAAEALVDTRTTAINARLTAKAAAEAAFGDGILFGIGDPIWHALWDAARRYAAVAGDPAPSFPTEMGEHCVLCHQEMSTEAADRMAGFDAFIKEDVEQTASSAETAWDAGVQTVSMTTIDTKDIVEGLRSLSERDSSLARTVRRRLASLRLRRIHLLKWAQADGSLAMIDISPIDLSAIDSAVAVIRSYADELAASADPEVRKALLAERDDLRDRQKKDALRTIADAEVQRLHTIKMLDVTLGDCASAAVTMFANKLADDFITARMRDRFQKEVVALAGSQVRVEVTRSGGKAVAPQFEVKLFADKKAKLHMVLSEGEQTCVALAAYLTELANAELASALVFDDPVTSLDHRWRNKVAERLVEEARTRQIIVFTHDLIFVNDLDSLAQDAGIPIMLSHLVRTPAGVGVVKEGLPWKGAKLGPRYDSLEKAVRSAKKLHEVGNEDAYERAAFSIYNDLRATWECAIEDVVFNQVILRHREYINTGGLIEVAVFTNHDANFVRAGFQKCCDYVSAHDPSRGKDTAPPMLDMIAADIKSLRDWTDGLRKRQKDSRKAKLKSDPTPKPVS